AQRGDPALAGCHDERRRGTFHRELRGATIGVGDEHPASRSTDLWVRPAVQPALTQRIEEVMQMSDAEVPLPSLLRRDGSGREALGHRRRTNCGAYGVAAQNVQLAGAERVRFWRRHRLPG